MKSFEKHYKIESFKRFLEAFTQIPLKCHGLYLCEPVFGL